MSTFVTVFQLLLIHHEHPYGWSYFFQFLTIAYFLQLIFFHRAQLILLDKRSHGNLVPLFLGYIAFDLMENAFDNLCAAQSVQRIFFHLLKNLLHEGEDVSVHLDSNTDEPLIQRSSDILSGRKGSALVWHSRGLVFESRCSKSCDL